MENNNQDLNLMTFLNKLNYEFFKIMEKKDQDSNVLEMKEQFIEELTNYLDMIGFNNTVSLFGIDCFVYNNEMNTVRLTRNEFASMYETFLDKENIFSRARFDESFYARIKNAKSLGNIHFFHNIYVYNENQVSDILKLKGPVFIEKPYSYQKYIEKIVDKSGYKSYKDINDDSYTGGTYKNSSVDKMAIAPFYNLLDSNSYDGTGQSIQVPRGLEGITYQECINRSKEFNKKCTELYPLFMEALKRFKNKKIKRK